MSRVKKIQELIEQHGLTDASKITGLPRYELVRITDYPINHEIANILLWDLKYDNLSIDVIRSVKQVYDEGLLLNHCVYENGYYKKQDSLLLSAKVNNEVIETIEVDLKNLTISQARGKDNHPSEYNELIVNLVNQNLKKIKSIHKKQLKMVAWNKNLV